MTGAAADLVTFGESMVSMRSPHPLSAGGSLTMHVAGAESNVAVGVARLGHSVRWAGVTGADPHGEFILRQIRGEGILADHRTDATRPTGVMFLEQRTADVTRAYYYRSGSAGSTITFEDVEGALLPGCRVLHLTGITAALGPTALDTVTYAAARAASLGITVSLDVNYRSKLWSRDEARAALLPLMQYVTVLIASDDELELVAPDKPRDSLSVAEPTAARQAGIAQYLFEQGVRDVVVKRGAAGAAVHTAEDYREAQAVQVTSIDTVGAGDAFTAGYLSAMLDGEDAAGCLRRGNLTGAFAVSTSGDWEGLPRRDELQLLRTTAAGTTQR